MDRAGTSRQGDDQVSGLTRRRLVTLGGSAAAAGYVGLAGFTGRALAAPRAGRAHLRRSSYTALRGHRFSVSGESGTTRVELVEVSDLLGARFDRRLRGHERGFALRFRGPAGAGLGQGMYRVKHPAVGRCRLFLAPVGEARGGRQDYEVVVDRTVARSGRSRI